MSFVSPSDRVLWQTLHLENTKYITRLMFMLPHNRIIICFIFLVILYAPMLESHSFSLRTSTRYIFFDHNKVARRNKLGLSLIFIINFIKSIFHSQTLHSFFVNYQYQLFTSNGEFPEIMSKYTRSLSFPGNRFNIL